MSVVIHLISQRWARSCSTAMFTLKILSLQLYHFCYLLKYGFDRLAVNTSVRRNCDGERRLSFYDQWSEGAVRNTPYSVGDASSDMSYRTFQ